jgi:S1-C subfamily serine protease
MRITHMPFVTLVLFVSGSWCLSAAASPVVDDKELGKAFVIGLGRLADATTADEPTTLSGDQVRDRLRAVEGQQAMLPRVHVEAARPIDRDRDVYGESMPAVVVIGTVFKCGKCDDWHPGGMATGWIASDNGIVVTNCHVLEKGEKHFFGVMTRDGAVYGIKDVLAADRAGDAAVIQLETRGERFPFLWLGHDPHCGDEVSIISHPVGRFFTLSQGAVSRFYRDDGVPKPPVIIAKDEEAKPDETSSVDEDSADRNAEETTPQASPAPAPTRSGAIWMSVTADYTVGSSGGPVVDATGQVVGMVSRVVTVVKGLPGDRGRPGGRPLPVPPPQSITFKDCVSLDTLRRVLASEKP